MAKKTTSKPAKTKALTPIKKDYTELKQKAFDLYMDTDLSQKEIAALLGVTEVTLSKWANPEGQPSWDDLRKLKSVGRPQALAKLYQRLIEQVDGKENSDAVHKTLLVIKSLEDKRTALPELINVMREFSEFVLSVDMPLAKQLVEVQTAFINKKVNERKQ